MKAALYEKTTRDEQKLVSLVHSAWWLSCKRLGENMAMSQIRYSAITYISASAFCTADADRTPPASHLVRVISTTSGRMRLSINLHH